MGNGVHHAVTPVNGCRGESEIGCDTMRDGQHPRGLPLRRLDNTDGGWQMGVDVIKLRIRTAARSLARVLTRMRWRWRTALLVGRLYQAFVSSACTARKRQCSWLLAAHLECE